MTQQRDIERLLDQWFSDGPSQAPDRVVDIVTDRIERQSQRPAWRLHWRPLPVHAYAKIAVAAAAVLIVAIVGYNLLPGGSTGVGGPAPTASPTTTATPTGAPSPTTTPSPTATFEYPTDGILPAGSNATKLFTPAFTFTVPEGWINDGDTAAAPGSLGYYSLFPDTPANRAEFARTGNSASGMVIVSNLERPWFVCEAWEDNRGTTAAEMATAVSSNEATMTTGLVDVAVGGLTGKQFDVRLDPAWTETCPGDPPGVDLGDQRTRAIFLDRPGSPVLVIFANSLHSADHEAFLAEAMPIIESFQFDTSQ
jgi:hypothetical protein